jgi:hypothetical protein
MTLSEAEMRRVTDVLLDQHGKKAARAVGKRADQSHDAGDRDNERMWLTILMMIEERQYRRRKEERARRRAMGAFFARLRPRPLVMWQRGSLSSATRR